MTDMTDMMTLCVPRTIKDAFAEVARAINAAFPPVPDTGYVGSRCGWYPEKPKPKRKRKASA